jgi:hypothetical protein
MNTQEPNLSSCEYGGFTERLRVERIRRPAAAGG